jgi:hypothetical protein
VFSAIKSAPAGEWARWGACILILLAPGSFVILPLVWIARQWTARGAVPAKAPVNRG